LKEARVRRISLVLQSMNGDPRQLLYTLSLWQKSVACFPQNRIETMIKRASAVFWAALILAPTLAVAHGQPPPAVHGGQMQEAHENWVELVVSGTQVKLYVLDEGRKPVPASQLSGSASMLMGGKIYKLELVPGADNDLEGPLPAAGPGVSAATVVLKIRGQAASARFAIGG